MGYIIGISSGIYTGGKGSEAYTGLSKKIYASIKYGVDFVQLDLQQLTEFLEPNLKVEMEKIKQSNYTFGIHGECAAFGSPVPLDSSLESEYKISHEKVIKHIEDGAKIGSKYVLFHSSEATPFPLATRDFKEIRLVDPWGRKFNEFLDENSKLLDWAIKNRFLEETIGWGPMDVQIEREVESTLKYYERNQKEVSPGDLEKIKKDVKEEIEKSRKDKLKLFVVSSQHFYLPDRISYPIVAKYMEMKKHPLWKAYVGDKSFEDVQNKIEVWVPAVTAMYIAGHFSPRCKIADRNLKEVMESNRMLILFETPMPQQPGFELYMRLPGLVQIYNLISYINSKYVGMAVDFEHLMTSNIDPKKEIAALPPRAGEKVKCIHAGAPVAYAKAHMAIEVGSDAQKYIYERLWELRQKGFKDGYVIYERAAEEGIKSSITSLKIIKGFLERDVPPNELPLEFYGLREEGPEYKRQELQIKQHALDPLKGLLMAPEEEHGILAGEVRKKGKIKEWGEGEEYR